MDTILNINSYNLIQYATSNELVWQFSDSCIEVTNSHSANENLENLEENNSNLKLLIDTLKSAQNIEIFDINKDYQESFNELIDWAKPDDLLLLVDDILLLCVSPLDKSLFLKQAS